MLRDCSLCKHYVPRANPIGHTFEVTECALHPYLYDPKYHFNPVRYHTHNFNSVRYHTHNFNSVRNHTHNLRDAPCPEFQPMAERVHAAIDDAEAETARLRAMISE